jgi:hypothetical protein
MFTRVNAAAVVGIRETRERFGAGQDTTEYPWSRSAAWPENHSSPERIAFQELICGERCTREAFVLRCGGDSQHPPALHCEPIANRKIADIAMVKADMIPAGNIGCMVRIAGGQDRSDRLARAKVG